MACAIIVVACSTTPLEVHGNGGSAGTTAAGSAAIGTATGGTTATTRPIAGGVAGASPATSAASGGVCTSFGAPMAVGTAQPTILANLSGLIASRSQPGVLYAHPDRSGAVFFALQESGVSLGQFTLTGISATDCEDIALGPGPNSPNTLYLGDIGDNTARPGTGAGRSEIAVYRVTEPPVSSTPNSSVTELTNWQILRFTYPDRTHDAETLLVDPINGDILIVTREADGSAYVFSAPNTASTTSTNELVQVALLQVGASGANAGDISPTGDRALIRTYAAAYLFPRSRGTSWQQAFAAAPLALSTANETQSEAATFGADGRSWLSSGEVDPIIYKATANCP